MDLASLHTILLQEYLLEGDINVIYSELDQVYSLTVSSGVKYVVKISHPDRSIDILQLEHAASHHLGGKGFPYQLQNCLVNRAGATITLIEGFHLRVLNWIPGLLLADINPQSKATRQSLGRMMGHVSMALSDFNHPAALRFIKWDPSQILWIEAYVDRIPEVWQFQFKKLLNRFEHDLLPKLKSVPWQINYNDANDYNILCQWDEQAAVYDVIALIDWLDMVYTARINELAIACAYTITKLPDPLAGACDILAAYHEVCPLEDGEYELLYHLILARLMISVTVATINKESHPENQYLQVSDQDAWNLIEKWLNIHPHLAWYTFRAACGLTPVPDFRSKISAIQENRYHPLLHDQFVQTAVTVDLGLNSAMIGNHSTYTNDHNLNANIQQLLMGHPQEWGIGKYDEVRPFYTSGTFKREGNNGPEWRTVHLGLDLFAPQGSTVYAPTDSIVHSIKDNAGARDYGPTIILRHDLLDFNYYTLYGHLSRASLLDLQPGDFVASGQKLGTIGAITENGGWPPHLHFQIILDLMDYTYDFPGVAEYQGRPVWTSISPDPVIMTGISSRPVEEVSIDELLRLRHQHVGRNLSVSYNKPLWMRRGQMQYLLDHTGRRYLDTVNNVAHCGHEHPAIVSRGQHAMAILNTNTRYLHENILDLAEQLTSHLHPTLEVCYFTNSGTEANELAIRMAKAYTQSQEIITMQWGYHGNSNTMVDLSSYKFDRKGGRGAPAHTHVLAMPDPFRGKYAGRVDESSLYLSELQEVLTTIVQLSQKPAALFVESILSCGGQVVYPRGYLKSAVDLIHDAGGLYIADEVQTGLGRIGSHFMAYEHYGVQPDIVTIGKPLGNGHPIGAVVCTQAVALSFYTGMEYFNTFGGNPVSCAIASEVLHTIRDEHLQAQAFQIGTNLKKEIKSFQLEFPILADVRGLGFFLGVELMKKQKPATKEANYLTRRMRESGILMSTDGPDDNVIKIKPPMCFNSDNANELLDRLRHILKEDPFRL